MLIPMNQNLPTVSTSPRYILKLFVILIKYYVAELFGQPLIRHRAGGGVYISTDMLLKSN